MLGIATLQLILKKANDVNLLSLINQHFVMRKKNILITKTKKTRVIIKIKNILKIILRNCCQYHHPRNMKIVEKDMVASFMTL